MLVLGLGLGIQVLGLGLESGPWPWPWPWPRLRSVGRGQMLLIMLYTCVHYVRYTTRRYLFTYLWIFGFRSQLSLTAKTYPFIHKLTKSQRL